MKVAEKHNQEERSMLIRVIHADTNGRLPEMSYNYCDQSIALGESLDCPYCRKMFDPGKSIINHIETVNTLPIEVCRQDAIVNKGIE